MDSKEFFSKFGNCRIAPKDIFPIPDGLYKMVPFSVEEPYQAFKERMRNEENDLIPSDEFVDKKK